MSLIFKFLSCFIRSVKGFPSQSNLTNEDFVKTFISKIPSKDQTPVVIYTIMQTIINNISTNQIKTNEIILNFYKKNQPTMTPKKIMNICKYFDKNSRKDDFIALCGEEFFEKILEKKGNKINIWIHIVKCGIKYD